MAIQDKLYNLHQEKERLDSFLSTITDSASAPHDEDKTAIINKDASEQEDHNLVAAKTGEEKTELPQDFTESPAIRNLIESERKQDEEVLPVEEKADSDYIAPEEPLPAIQETAPLRLEREIRDSLPAEELEPEQASIQADIPKTDETPALEMEKESYQISSGDDEYKPTVDTRESSELHVEEGEHSEALPQAMSDDVSTPPEIAHEETPVEESEPKVEEIVQLLQKVDVQERKFAASVIPEEDQTARIEPAVLTRKEQKSEDADLSLSDKEEVIKQDAAKPAKKEKKPFHFGALLRAGVLFVVFVAVIQGYLWMNPEIGEQSVHWLAQNVPGMDKILNGERAKHDVVTDSVKFINVKQRNVSNVFLGNLRIVEGFAVNSAAYPVAKIRIIGELYDGKNKVVATKVSYGGNVVSDERLASLNEEEIKSALSIPQGSDLSNNRIPPGGKIPFMVVFAREPAGVAKTTIMPLSVDKLAP